MFLSSCLSVYLICMCLFACIFLSVSLSKSACLFFTLFLSVYLPVYLLFAVCLHNLRLALCVSLSASVFVFFVSVSFSLSLHLFYSFLLSPSIASSSLYSLTMSASLLCLRSRHHVSTRWRRRATKRTESGGNAEVLGGKEGRKEGRIEEKGKK